MVMLLLMAMGNGDDSLTSVWRFCTGVGGLRFVRLKRLMEFFIPITVILCFCHTCGTFYPLYK